MSAIKDKVKKLLGREDPNRPTRQARLWSNDFIRSIAPHAQGRIVNVSAWKDEDKAGGHYRDYFTAAERYETTNYDGWRGSEAPTDHNVDLLGELPGDLVGAFDLVLNHTTLEHVYDAHKALSVLCRMSRDAVLVIMPWMQHLHGPEDGDFWRFSPYAMRRMLAANDFAVVREEAGPVGAKVQYLGYLAARDAKRWDNRLALAEHDAVATLRQAI